MNPRIEEKLELSKQSYPEAISWLHSKGFSILHPSRIVNSVYFDNSRLQMLFDAQEGITPRRKIRIRYYGDCSLNSMHSFALEVKESTAFGRLKSTQSNLGNNYLTSGVYDKVYGLCLPVIKITYNREYFILGEWRVTIDRNIVYENHGNLNLLREKAFDNSQVLEIKTSFNQDKDLLRNFFDFPRSKFSKYERAFDHLGL